MSYQSWAQVVYQSFQRVWEIIARFIPSFVAALIILVIGLLVASLVRSLLERIVSALRVDSLLRKIGLDAFVERAGYRLNSAHFVGALGYWFLVLVIVLTVSDVLGLWGLSSFLNEVLTYFPNLIVAVLILIASLIIANFLRGLVRSSVAGAKLHASKFFGSLTWWVTVIFGFLAALLQLGIAGSLIQILIIGFIAMLALAGGIAFGLGGKDQAAYLLEKLRQHFEEK